MAAPNSHDPAIEQILELHDKFESPEGHKAEVIGGTIVGLITGFFRGLVDDIVSRVIEAVLALPLIVIAVTVLAAFGRAIWVLIVVIGLVFTPIVSRTVRAAVLSERSLEYVQAARLRRPRRDLAVAGPAGWPASLAGPRVARRPRSSQGGAALRR